MVFGRLKHLKFVALPIETRCRRYRAILGPCGTQYVIASRLRHRVWCFLCLKVVTSLEMLNDHWINTLRKGSTMDECENHHKKLKPHEKEEIDS